MILIYLLLVLCLIGFVNFTVAKIRRDMRLGRPAFNFRENNAIVYTIITMIVVYFSVNIFVDDPSFESTAAKITYGKETKQPWLVTQSYRAMFADDSLNPDIAFGIIDAHFDPAQELGPGSYLDYNHEEEYIYQYFRLFKDSKDTSRADFSHLFQGIHFFYLGDMRTAEEHLNLVRNHDLKYYNNFAGRVNFYNNKRELGYANLRREIKLNGYKEGAYNNLAKLYEFEQRYDQLIPLVYNEESKQYVPYEIRTRIYMQFNDFGNYFKDLWETVILSGNRIGIAGALLILIAWMVYLLRVNIQRSSGVLMATLTVMLSAGMTFFVWLLYDFAEFRLGFTLNGEVWNDLFYCIFGIGFIEELVKIIPFLILLRFTKKIKEPIDYIMFASLSALGFAFIENILYFKEDSLNIMHSRALTASVSHMINSSIVAYGLILAKFRKQKSSVLYFFLFFFLAMVSHGFYDFWLLNPVVNDYWIVTFVYLLSSILIYASFINNALNNSTNPQANIHLNSAKLSSNLAAWFVGVFLFEFICMTWIYGPTISNSELIGSTLGGGYLVLFISVRLSNIDVFPGEWYNIGWFIGFTPTQIIYGDKRPNYNLSLGMKISITNFRPKSKLAKLLPVNGEIIRREKIRGSTAWYLVKIDPMIKFSEYNHGYILVRAKNPVEVLSTEYETIAHFAAIKNLDTLNSSQKTDDTIAFIDWVKVKVV